MIRTLAIVQRGLISFAFCGRCNARFASKLLSPLRAKNDIQEKYASHRCGEVEGTPASRVDGLQSGSRTPARSDGKTASPAW